MTIAYWCLLIAIFLPYAFTGFAKITCKFSPKDNHNTRQVLDSLPIGPSKRAHWAQLNSFEVTPAFAAAILVAHQIGTAAQGTLDGIAIAFVVSRVIFGYLYIADKALLRTIVWTFGMGCIAALFIVSA